MLGILHGFEGGDAQGQFPWTPVLKQTTLLALEGLCGVEASSDPSPPSLWRPTCHPRLRPALVVSRGRRSQGDSLHMTRDPSHSACVGAGGRHSPCSKAAQCPTACLGAIFLSIHLRRTLRLTLLLGL